MQAANPDVVFAATLPIDTAGIIRAANEVGFKPKLIGGAMLGLLVTGIKQQLGTDDQRLHQQRVLHPGAEPAVRRHQGDDGGVSEARRRARHRSARLHLSALCLCGRTDPGQGRDRRPSRSTTTSWPTISARHTFDTVIGPIEFGPDGEWKTPRIICIQFQGISGSDLGQFKDWSRQVVVYPTEYKSGNLIYPFERAAQ